MIKLAARCVACVTALLPVSLPAEETAADGPMEQQAPPPAAPLAAMPVPPPSGPYPAPMMLRKPATERFIPRSPAEAGAGTESNWQLGGGEPQSPPEPTYPPPAGAPTVPAPPPPVGHSWQPSAMAPPGSYRPLEPDTASPPSASAGEPQEAQKMQPDEQSVNKTPASQSEPRAGRPMSGQYYPAGPGYGYGYPMPPGYGYPPPGYGYGYPPPPYGYPAQSAPGQGPAGQQPSTQAE